MRGASRRGLTLVGPVAPPVGGIATHVADLHAFALARGVPCRVVPPRRELAFFTALGARALVDVVHVHVHGHSVRAWLQASGPSVAPRALLTVHSGLCPGFVSAHARLVRACCAGYAAIVGVSAAVVRALADAGVPADRLHEAPAFVREAVDTRLAPAGLAGIRRRHACLFAAPAASEHEYGVDVLLDAWPRIRAARPDAGLILYGRHLRRPDLHRPGVYLYGELSRQESLGVIAACDVLLRPSRADGDAICVREALALGKPAVASDAAVRPPGTRLHRTDDPEDLASGALAALAAPAPATSVADATALLGRLYRELGLDIPEKEAPCAESQVA